MSVRLYNEFLESEDSLQIYEGSELIFASTRDRLLPLMEYINDFSPCQRPVVIFDRIVGNAAALLAVLANCRKIYSPLGSQHAVRTLEEYGIGHYLDEIVPYIKRADEEDVCPMEKLSLNKDPEEFYHVMRSIVSSSQQEPQPDLDSGGG
jgi:hypothetical protein